jgi:hypothetical protein
MLWVTKMEFPPLWRLVAACGDENGIPPLVDVAANTGICP